MENSCSFFQNNKCEYFPCHMVSGTENFNCLFCFCPLYGNHNCGGNYSVLENGTKDCSACTLPHKPENYEYIIKKLSL